MRRVFVFAVCSVGLLLLTGCPDYSHLRAVPDYANMTDGGNELMPRN